MTLYYFTNVFNWKNSISIGKQLIINYLKIYTRYKTIILLKYE